jgi:hypothetical protein
LGIKKLLEKKLLDTESFINKGAEVSADKQHNKAQWSNYTLRIRKDISTDIDQAVEQRVGLSKSAWIMEAIQEKLRKNKECL